VNRDRPAPVRAPEPAGNAILLAVAVSLIVLVLLACGGSVLLAGVIGVAL